MMFNHYNQQHYEQNKEAVSKLFKYVFRYPIYDCNILSIYKGIEIYYKYYIYWHNNNLSRTMSYNYNIIIIIVSFLIQIKVDSDYTYKDIFSTMYNLLRGISLKQSEIQEIFKDTELIIIKDNQNKEENYIVHTSNLNKFLSEKEALGITEIYISYNNNNLINLSLSEAISFLSNLELTILKVLDWNVYAIITPADLISNFLKSNKIDSGDFIKSVEKNVYNSYLDPKYKNVSINELAHSCIKSVLKTHNISISEDNLNKFFDM